MSSPTGSIVVEKALEMQVDSPEDLAAISDKIDPAIEKRIKRKCDLTIAPWYFFVYLWTFIDRANIGNARVAGLGTDLGLEGVQFNIALTVFYIFYALWEMQSNLVTRYISLKIWIALQVVAFGLICMCTGFITNFGQLVALRVLLGLAEGGVQPALSLGLGRFYRRHELVVRINLLLGAAAMAGAWGGLLAGGFVDAAPVYMGQSWRNIFIFEGIITMAVGVASYFIVPNTIETAWFLTAEEKAVAILRLKLDKGGSTEVDKGAKWRLVKQSWFYPFNWICAWAYFGTNVSVQGASLFLPSILRNMYPDYSTVRIQLLSVPPYVAGFAWAMSLAVVSSKLNKRGPVLVICGPLVITGYALFLSQTNLDALYAACFLALLGCFPVGPYVVAWAMNSAATDAERGVSSSLVPGWGQLGAIVATWSYIGSEFERGHAINQAMCTMTWLLVITMMWWTWHENKKRARGDRDHRLEKVPAGEDATTYLGSLHPQWRFAR